VKEATQKPAALIQILKPEAVDFSAKMEHTPFSIGRRKGNDAVLPLDSSSGVSGNHLTVTFLDGNYYVKDEKSTYGTSSNNNPMEKGKLYPLQDGDVLGLGPEVKIVFRISSSD
jgi:pSer/pThr/pTyr-binding forkhead associated (FHA) protein